ncbi:MAG: Trans-aconitate 2-methyltransferase [Syntrophorhabdus sp. PtaU1.Bin058]|nr:MAG: Trans-aconitate 2-methyltransferase [Syntrophorhabdus sp. PtaU1.Bin058]
MTHEFDGKKYEEASAHQKEWGSALIGELDLQGDERVLDLGCGDGVLTAQIAGLVPNGRVTGIDASQGMIEAALPRTRDNLRFILMDINAIGFHEEFDVVFSNATLHWIKDHRRLLRHVRRSLRDMGRVRFNFAGEGNCLYFFRVIREAMSLEKYSPYFAGFQWPWYMPPLDEYRELVKEAGFHEARVWGENADRYFPDTDTMVRWVDQPNLVPFLPCIPEEQRAGFREWVVKRMIEETQQQDGRCFETFRRINVSARKQVR